MPDAQLYFLSDQYYIDFPDDKLMKNKDTIDGVAHSRPCFLAFPDAKNPAIYWLVPISSRYEKYQKIAQAKIEKYGRCNTIRFGTVLGRNAAFLIQNMCPVTAPYLTAYINKKAEPVRLDDRVVADVAKNTREVLAIARRGAKVIFPDVFKIYQAWKPLSENKNRGTQVVKLCVPFLFSVFAKAAVPEPPLPRRRGGANQNAAPCQKKKRVWNGGIGTLCRGSRSLG